jgi:hypothetical protein
MTIAWRPARLAMAYKHAGAVRLACAGTTRAVR